MCRKVEENLICAFKSVLVLKITFENICGQDYRRVDQNAQNPFL